MDEGLTHEGAGSGSPVAALNLAYEDEPVELDLGAIMGDGRRMRGRRTLMKATGIVGAAAAVLGLATVVHSGSGAGTRAAGGGASPIASLLRAQPPVVGPITVGTQPDHWTTEVWQIADGQVCVASYRMPMQGDAVSAECLDTVDAWLRTGDDGIGVPTLTAQPTERGAVAAIGIVRGDIARVDVSWSGLTSSAAVFPFTTENGQRIGIYQVFMRIPPGLDHFEGSQVDTLLAYDASGSVVARHTRWAPPPQK